MNSITKQKFPTLVILCICLFVQLMVVATVPALASILIESEDENEQLGSLEVADSLQEFQLLPQIYLWGFSGDHTLAQGQGLLPVFWYQDRMLYGAVEGKIADSSDWLGALGFGYRQMIENRIYGGYALISYNQASSHFNYTALNAGVEDFGEIWDFRINGYLPFSSEDKTTTVKWADEFGINKYIKYTQHKEFNARIEQTTINDLDALWGIDAEVGRSIPHLEDLKCYLGGYFYDNRNLSDIRGVAARIRYDLNRYISFELKDSYDDNRHNTALFGMRFAFGGFSADDRTEYGVAAKLLEPIEHNFATMAKGYGIPTETGTFTKVTSEDTLEHDNIQFIEPSGASSVTSAVKGANAIVGDGTFENPYIGFNNEVLQAISAKANQGTTDKYPLLFFAPGDYAFNSFTSRSINGRFALPNGWSMNGLMSDAAQPQLKNFAAAALNEKRPRFFGGLDLNYGSSKGDAETKIISIKIINDKGSNDPSLNGGGENAAIYVKGAGNVMLQNVSAESHVTDSNKFAIGMYIDNSILNIAALDTKNNGQNDFMGDGSQKGHGIFIAAENGASQLNFLSGKNFATSSGSGNDPNSNVALFAHPGKNGVITVNFQNGENNISSQGIGIRILSESTVSGATTNLKLNGGTNTVSSRGDAVTAELQGPTSTNIEFADGINTFKSLQQRGIYINAAKPNSVVNIKFNGGSNRIEGGQFVGESTSVYLYNLYGTVNVNFIGGTNEIISVGDTISKGIAIYSPSNTNINFYGGKNIISASASSINGTAYGIYDYSGSYSSMSTIIRFIMNTGEFTKVNITAGGYYRYGIYAHAYDSDPLDILDSKGQQITADSIKTYVDFVSRYGTSGNALDWSFFDVPWY